MENLPPIEAHKESKGAGSLAEGHSAEPLTLLADALLRTTQYQAQAVEQNRIIVQVKDTLADAIVAFSSFANSTIQAAEKLQATADKIESSNQLVAAKQREILGVLDRNIKKFKTLLVWTLFLAGLGAYVALIALVISYLSTK